MIMDFSKFPYSVHLTGQHLRASAFDPAFREQHYYPDIEYAMGHLLRIEPASLVEKFARHFKSPRYYDAAGIFQRDGEEAVRLTYLLFEDTPEGVPPAGVYLQSIQEDDFNERFLETGCDFDKLEGCSDPEAGLVQLANFLYDGKLQIEK